MNVDWDKTRHDLGHFVESAKVQLVLMSLLVLDIIFLVCEFLLEAEALGTYHCEEWEVHEGESSSHDTHHKSETSYHDSNSSLISSISCVHLEASHATEEFHEVIEVLSVTILFIFLLVHQITQHNFRTYSDYLFTYLSTAVLK